ncbi:MAG: hypothetical protein V1932_04280 [Chloroflexota bacterium]
MSLLLADIYSLKSLQEAGYRPRQRISYTAIAVADNLNLVS